MVRSYGRFVALILLTFLISEWSDGARAQSDSEREKAVPSGLRQTRIREAELWGGASRKPKKKPKNHRPPSRRGRADDEQVPAEKAAIRPHARGAEALPLLARITSKTSPQRAASLKLIDKGRESLVAGEYKQALGTFERSIAVDATNPYSHYFVARAHFFLGNYPVSFNFLDVAESLLGWHKLWLSEIYVLKGRNATAMGFLGRADTNYFRALGFDPYNRFAFERLANIDPIMERAELLAP